MNILSESQHQAQKHYYCSMCQSSIFMGESYSRVYAKLESDFYREKPHDLKLCSRCHTPASQMHVPPTSGPDGYEYVRTHYQVPVTVGQRIMAGGETGTVVVPVRPDQYIHIRLDASGRVGWAHPTWETVYYGDDGSVLADYQQQKVEVAV